MLDIIKRWPNTLLANPVTETGMIWSTTFLEGFSEMREEKYLKLVFVWVPLNWEIVYLPSNFIEVFSNSINIGSKVLQKPVILLTLHLNQKLCFDPPGRLAFVFTSRTAK